MTKEKRKSTKVSSTKQSKLNNQKDKGRKFSKMKKNSKKISIDKQKGLKSKDCGICSEDQPNAKKKKKGENDIEENTVKTIISSKKKRKDKDGSQRNKIVLVKKTKVLGVDVGNKVEEVSSSNDVLYLSSGDEDCLKGMKKWLTEYNGSRKTLEDLQTVIDNFLVDHDKKIEQERMEREASAAEDGWTVVKRHRGNKKTTESETGTSVESASQVAIENQLTKKKPKEVGKFYRFQKREAEMNEILMLQSKFEEDRKRIQHLRAARKFRPY